MSVTDPFTTQQEGFWAGDFGNEYVGRNREDRSLGHRLGWFSEILSYTQDVKSVFEFGANIGHNLRAIRALISDCKCEAVEINQSAYDELKGIPGVVARHGSILGFTPAEFGMHDLTMTVGVLIHINPEMLPEVYERLYQCSRKYILVFEYYNPRPVEVAYRGHSERLFKRDFAGEMLDRFTDLKLVRYGFFYHRDPLRPSDDATWFLLEKK